MLRGFMAVVDEKRKTQGDVMLPVRATEYSAGYDFYSPVDIEVLPGKPTLIWTDVKAIMDHGEVLLLFVRSSMGKKMIVLANGTGIIDADYQGNPDNDGNIGIMILNLGEAPYSIKRGDRIAQGIFLPYLTADHDGNTVQQSRKGGFGSTNGQ